METVVTWWCELLGITDPISLKAASGAAAIGLFLFLAWVLAWIVIRFIGLLYSPEMNRIMAAGERDRRHRTLEDSDYNWAHRNDDR